MCGGCNGVAKVTTMNIVGIVKVFFTQIADTETDGSIRTGFLSNGKAGHREIALDLWQDLPNQVAGTNSLSES